jgi:hypothetical protein
MPIDWRKGFNRVFVLATLAWIGYALFIYPIQEREEGYRYYTQGLAGCIEAKPPGNPEMECEKLEEKLWKTRIDQYPIPLFWQPDWPSRLLVAGAVVAVPAVVYGMFQLGWLVVAWVIKGFRPRLT